MRCVIVAFILILFSSVARSDTASFYSYESTGHKTANGEVYNPQAFTAASPNLPFGTMVRVTNVKNGKSVVVRINDRGPYVRGRNIDLSLAAAQQIDMVKSGVANVEIVVLV